MPKKRRKPMREQEGTEDLRRQFIKNPMVQSRVRISASAAAGSTSLGWYRGQHCGLDEAALWLEEHHPRIGKKFRKHFSLNEDGSMGIR